MAVQEIGRNSKYFFSYAKKKSQTSSSIGPLIKNNGVYTTDDKEMSELLRKQYETLFSSPHQSKRVEDQERFFMEDNRNITQISDIEFGPPDMERAINCMPLHSAPGPDSWSSVLLKNCKVPLAIPLAILWRKSLDSGEIPGSLKNTMIAPLHKGVSKVLQKKLSPGSTNITHHQNF